MKKDTPTYIRLTKEEKRMLQELATATVRTQSDMIRSMIKEKHAQVFGGDKAQGTQDYKVSPQVG